MNTINKTDIYKRSFAEYTEAQTCYDAFVEFAAYKAAKLQQRTSAAAMTQEQRNTIAQFLVLKEEAAKLEKEVLAHQAELPKEAESRNGRRMGPPA